MYIYLLPLQAKRIYTQPWDGKCTQDVNSPPHSCTKGDIFAEAQKFNSPTKPLSRPITRQPRP